MYAIRRWVVRHADLVEFFYNGLFEPVLVRLHPLWQRIGYQRVEKPMAAVEKVIKGSLFDCQMCGHCILSSTGMSCPMNCPKNLRNGPCSGVRPNGHCEVKPEMRCVWVEAWEGSRRMRQGAAIQIAQKPAPLRDKGTSSWLRVAREKGEQRCKQQETQP